MNADVDPWRKLILNYHSIWDAPVPLAAGIDLSPARFQQHLEHLVACGRRLVHLDELLADDAPGVAVTFDDGYLDNLTAALPLLDRFQVPATVFVATDMLGKSWDSAAGPMPSLRADQLPRLVASGQVRVGSHGARHVDLTTLSDAELADDLGRSKATLEDLLGDEVPYLAYPFGAFDARVMAAARAAGYRDAFTVFSPAPAPFARVRVPLARGDDRLRLRVKMSRPYAWLKRWLRPGPRP